MLLVTVVKTWGSSPRPEGAMLAVHEDGHVVGSVSGGCIEDDLIERVRQRGIEQDKPEAVKYGISAEEAHRFRLPCGGTIQLVLEPLTRESGIAQLCAAVESGRLLARTLDMESDVARLEPARHRRRPVRWRYALDHPRSALSDAGDRRGTVVAIFVQYRGRAGLSGDRVRSARGIYGRVGRAGHDSRAHHARRHRDGYEARRALRGHCAHARSETRRSRADGSVENARVLRRRARFAAQ